VEEEKDGKGDGHTLSDSNWRKQEDVSFSDDGPFGGRKKKKQGVKTVVATLKNPGKKEEETGNESGMPRNSVLRDPPRNTVPQRRRGERRCQACCRAAMAAQHRRQKMRGDQKSPRLGLWFSIPLSRKEGGGKEGPTVCKESRSLGMKLRGILSDAKRKWLGLPTSISFFNGKREKRPGPDCIRTEPPV